MYKGKAFTKKLSTRQEVSLGISLVCFFFLGLILWYKNNPIMVFTNLIGFFILMIVLCILVFISDYFRRIEIQYNRDDENYQSKYEKTFADYLKRKNVRYQLHPKIKVKRKKEKINVIPDFYLPEFEVYVEIWGMIGDEEYKTYYNLKKETYNKNQIEHIDIYPKNFENLDWDFTTKMFEIFKVRQGVQRDWKK